MSNYARTPLAAVIALGAGLAASGVFLYAFLKLHSRIMNRLGPMYAGRFHGVGQPIAEVIKPIQKEDIIPTAADRPVFKLAPVIALLSSFLLLAVIPVGPGLVVANLDLGLFYLLAISGLAAIAVVMAAYGSQSKFTLIGGLRAVGQIIAYELPIVLAAAAIAMLAGTLSLTQIVQAQHLPFAIWPFPFGAIAFVMLLLSSFAEVMWQPFDMPMAESEIISGHLTEYSGMRFIFFYMSEFVHVVAFCAIVTILFLGGWRGPVLPPVVWFLVKAAAVSVFFIWIRFTLPRLREDQLQRFAWKVLIPLGLLNVLGIALFKVLTA
jgi:NADH-quinone oxidoreductase subunit H